jgi:hypothetical protein
MASVSDVGVKADEVSPELGGPSNIDIAPDVINEDEETTLLGSTGVRLRIKKRLLREPGELREHVKHEGSFGPRLRSTLRKH